MQLVRAGTARCALSCVARAERATLTAKRNQATAVIRQAQADVDARGLTPAQMSDFCVRLAGTLLYIFEMPELEVALTGVTSLVEGRTRTTWLIATLLGHLASFAGSLLGVDALNALASMAGRTVAASVIAGTARRAIGAVGESLVDVCVALTEQAVTGGTAGAAGASPDFSAIQRQFLDGVERRMQG